ncbi:MAG TPA: molybdenum cofactor biosynthesis protein MoaE [Planctomycetota bacterium]|nr:molybdenum cofactor biosynthesis protein MoaE [Planctomycetota bacterium]
MDKISASKSSSLNAALNISRVSVLLTRELLDPTLPTAEVQDPTTGAVATFIGTTRSLHEGRKILSLEYEAQEPMAHKALKDICNDALQKFSLCKARVHHRLGKVDVSQISVIVAVSSLHRAAAFDGCRYIIDTLKTTVPIFKKEHYADGSPAQWIGPDGKPVTL